MQNFTAPDFIMDGRVLCPSLPDLLRKTILTFCEGSVKFQRTLEVIGSIHICSDSEKIATFLLDEQVTRPVVGAGAHASDSTSKVATNETLSPQCDGIISRGCSGGGANSGNNNGNSGDIASVSLKTKGSSEDKSSTTSTGTMLPPKKSRKTLKPVRKINYRYIQSLESSDAESDSEYIVVDSGGRDSNGLQPGRDYIASRPLGMLEKRMREYLENTDSNASMSSEDTYKHPPSVSAFPVPVPASEVESAEIIRQESEAQTSPSGPVSYEVTSTRPDDAVSVDQVTNESPSLSPQDSTPKQGSPSSGSPEITTAVTEDTENIVKQEVDPEAKFGFDSAYARSYESALILSTLATANSRPVFNLVDPKSFGTDQTYSVYNSNSSSNNNNNNNSNSSNSSSVTSITEQTRKPLSTVGGIFVPQQEQLFAEDLRSRRYSSPEPTATFNNSGRGTQKETQMEGSWDKPVLCKICGRALKSEKMLDIHMNTAHTHKTIYPCKQCGKVFYAASSLHSHKKRTHTSMEQKYKCPHCDRFYAFQSELLRHIDTAHMELVSMSASQVGLGSDVAAFWAAYRESPAVNTDGVPPQQQQHPLLQLQPQIPQLPSQPREGQPQQHQNGLTTASATHSAFTPPLPSQSEDLKPQESHIEQDIKPEPGHNGHNNNNTKNNNNNIVPPSEETKEPVTAVTSAMGLRYKCNICGMLLKSKECLSLHVNAKHTQKQAYPCNVCGKVFYAPSSRFCHIRRVHASTEQKFHCDYCDKIFTFHYELRNHLKLMHRNKLIQRADGNISETEPSNGEVGEDGNDLHDLSNGIGSPTQELASPGKVAGDQG